MSKYRAPLSKIESREVPLLTKGGPSSSDQLNRIQQALLGDIATGRTSLEQVTRDQGQALTLLAAQTTGIHNLVASLQTLIPGAPAGRGRADFYTSLYVDGSNTAGVDFKYGVATLPVSNVQEKMILPQPDGSAYVPESARIRTAYQSSYSPGSLPADDAFGTSLDDYLGIGPDPTTFFPGLPSSGYVFIKLVLPPALLQHRLSNRLNFNLLPVFQHTLSDCYIRNTAGAYVQVDITYLPGYQAGQGAVALGPTQLYFPATEITEVVLVAYVSGWWGVQTAGVQLVSYNTLASLNLDFTTYGLSSLATVIFGGQNTFLLSQLPYTISGSKVNIPISQTSIYATPVFTYVEVRSP